LIFLAQGITENTRREVKTRMKLVSAY
jgi:hypothetical protein